MNYKFYLHNYSNNKGERGIFLDITSEGKRKRIPTGLKIKEKLWNHQKGKAFEKTQEGIDINLILNSLEKKITEVKISYRLSETYLTLDKFEQEFKNGFTRMDFVAFFHAQLELDRPTMNKNTFKAQKGVYNKLRQWRETIPFSDITFDLIQKFKNHVISRDHAKTTMNNNLKVIKKFLNIAQKRGIKFPIDTREIVCGPTSGNRVDLDANEIKRMVEYYNSSFMKNSHILPVGKFLLACFTGLRISDIQQINPGMISDEQMKFTSVKTGKRQVVSLNYSSQDVIERYPQILTAKISDQGINRKLKEVANICGIKKNLTFHVARHTFATNFLRFGGSAPALQKILGHSDISETMIYVHIVEEEANREIFIMDQILRGDSQV